MTFSTSNLEETFRKIQSTRMKDVPVINENLSVKTIGFQGNDYTLSNHENWKFSNKAKSYLESIKRGDVEDEFGWTVEV